MNEQSNQHTVRAYNVELDQLRHLIRSITPADSRCCSFAEE
jgi:hypothetical protein